MAAGKKTRMAGPKAAMRWIPNTLTAGNLVCGFGAVLLSIDYARRPDLGSGLAAFDAACWLVILGGVFDLFDGKAARWFGSSGPFGMKLDSFADMITFGLAPSIILACTLLKPESLPYSLGWLSCGVYFFAAVFRLARYNVSTADIPYGFVGLPSPGAAATVVSYFMVARASPPSAWISALVVVAAGIFMVSPIPYPGLKQHGRLENIVIFSIIGIGLIGCAIFGGGPGVLYTMLFYDLLFGWLWAVYLRHVVKGLEKKLMKKR